MATRSITGAQLLSGRMLDSRLSGYRFKPHQQHCIMSLSKTHYSLHSTGSTQEDPSRHNWKIVDWALKNQIKQTRSIKLKFKMDYPLDVTIKKWLCGLGHMTKWLPYLYMYKVKTLQKPSPEPKAQRPWALVWQPVHEISNNLTFWQV